MELPELDCSRDKYCWCLLCDPTSLHPSKPTSKCAFHREWYSRMINFVCCCQYARQDPVKFQGCTVARPPCPCELCDGCPIKEPFYENYSQCRHESEVGRFCHGHLEEVIRRIVISTSKPGRVEINAQKILLE